MSWRTLKRRMHKSIRNEFSGLFERDREFVFNAEAAIYWFAADHGGRGSDLSAIASNSPYRPAPSFGSVKDEGEVAEMMYEHLEDHFCPSRTGMGGSRRKMGSSSMGDARETENLLKKASRWLSSISDSRDWYIASYTSGEVKPGFKQYHPFGKSFQIKPWDLSEPIDKHERGTYKRIKAEFIRI